MEEFTFSIFKGRRVTGNPPPRSVFCQNITFWQPHVSDLWFLAWERVTIMTDLTPSCPKTIKSCNKPDMSFVNLLYEHYVILLTFNCFWMMTNFLWICHPLGDHKTICLSPVHVIIINSLRKSSQKRQGMYSVFFLFAKTGLI